MKSAWSVTRARGLDPEYAERIERAAADDDLEAFELAAAELLDALE